MAVAVTGSARWAWRSAGRSTGSPAATPHHLQLRRARRGERRLALRPGAPVGSQRRVVSSATADLRCVRPVVGGGLDADRPRLRVLPPARTGRRVRGRDRARTGCRPDGTVYFADSSNGVVAKVTKGGQLQIVAGGGNPADGVGDGGPATSAHLEAPWDVAVAPDGSLLIADSADNRVRRVGPGGTISTVVGGGDPEGLGDGLTGPQARLSQPRGVALAASGELYIADTGHDRVRVLCPDGTVGTIAGGGSPARRRGRHPARQQRPPRDAGRRRGLRARHLHRRPRRQPSARGQRHRRHHQHRRRQRRLRRDGGRCAGVGSPLAGPTGVSVLPDGSLLIADRLHNRIRSVTSDGVIDTVFGTGHRAILERLQRRRRPAARGDASTRRTPSPRSLGWRSP